MHGRPRTFKGKYYASVFIHYVPAEWPLGIMDAQYAVPPHWADMDNKVGREQGAGCWVLGAGRWVLGAGCWVLGMCHDSVVTRLPTPYP